MNACVVSAPMSGSGKTTVTLGLLYALRLHGIAVQPFKVGPDFIDAGLHEMAGGVPSHNLDGWMLSRKTNEWLFSAASTAKSVAVVEGVMGLFDGFEGGSERGSTAEMAKWLDLPVILVIDAHAMARSAAAVIYGFQAFDPKVRVSGVIFNRVAGEGHYRILAEAVEDVPVLGWLPFDAAMEIPERHLGLLTSTENEIAARVSAIGEFFDRRIDLDLLMSAMAPVRIPLSVPPALTGRGGKRIAIAHDKAFSFYYYANRMALEDAGAAIIEFSPLTDREMPKADLLYIGGGYPELYRLELEANGSMRASIKRFIESGGRFYAECGGLMYLSESIDGAQMAGVLPVTVEMTGRPVDFGYCEVATRCNSILGPAGTVARGHQFHYSRAVGATGDAYTVQQGGRQYQEGFCFPNGVASYIHLHFLSNPAIPRNMLES